MASDVHWSYSQYLKHNAVDMGSVLGTILGTISLGKAGIDSSSILLHTLIREVIGAGSAAGQRGSNLPKPSASDSRTLGRDDEHHLMSTIAGNRHPLFI